MYGWFIPGFLVLAIGAPLGGLLSGGSSHSSYILPTPAIDAAWSRSGMCNMAPPALSLRVLDVGLTTYLVVAALFPFIFLLVPAARKRLKKAVNKKMNYTWTKYKIFNNPVMFYGIAFSFGLAILWGPGTSSYFYFDPTNGRLSCTLPTLLIAIQTMVMGLGAMFVSMISVMVLAMLLSLVFPVGAGKKL